MSKLLSIILVSTLFVHCSVNDDMDDMKETTNKMEKTTKKVSSSTEQLKNRTEDLYKGAREVISILNQNINFDDVIEIENSNISDKLLTASIFFASMEFQHWQGDYEDSLEVRQELMRKAIQYFFWKIDGLIDDSMPVDTPKYTKVIPWLGENYKNWLNLSVFAVAMSKIHEQQIQVAFKKSVPVYSIYSIIKEALDSKEKLLKGEVLPAYIEEVLKNEQVAIYLLQLRHNFYPLILASKISDIEDGFWNSLMKTYFRWEVNPGQFNKAQYAHFEELLERGFETRNFLKEQKVEVAYNSVVKDIFKNLMWVVHDLNPYQSIITKMGMRPHFDEVEKFQVQYDYKIEVKTEPEKLIVLLNEYTGSTLFVFYPEGAKKAEAEEEARIERVKQERKRKNLFTINNA